MSKFIKNTILFGGLLLLFNLLLLRFSRPYYYEYFRVPDKMWSSFLMADSHGQAVPITLEKEGLYNFSMGSESYYDIKRKIIFLLRNGYAVDTLYLSVDDHMLSPYRDRANNTDKSVAYLSREDYNYYYTYIKDKVILPYLPIVQPKVGQLMLRKTIASYRSEDLTEGDSTEGKESWAQLPEAEKIQLSSERKQSQFPSDAKSKALENELQDIIQLCKTHEIVLIGIKFPLSSTYRTEIEGLNYGADSAFYENELPVSDRTAMFGTDDTHFINQDHLDSLGGAIFIQNVLTTVRK